MNTQGRNGNRVTPRPSRGRRGAEPGSPACFPPCFLPKQPYYFSFFFFFISLSVVSWTILQHHRVTAGNSFCWNQDGDGLSPLESGEPKKLSLQFLLKSRAFRTGSPTSRPPPRPRRPRTGTFPFANQASLWTQRVFLFRACVSGEGRSSSPQGASVAVPSRAWRCRCGGKKAVLSGQDQAGTFSSFLESSPVLPDPAGPSSRLPHLKHRPPRWLRASAGCLSPDFLKEHFERHFCALPDCRELDFSFSSGCSLNLLLTY